MPSGPIRLFLLDDRRLVRALLERILASEPGFTVVATSADAHEARAFLRHARDPIDVAVVNLALPDDSAIELLPELHARFPKCRIVALDPPPGQSRRRAFAIASGASVALSIDAGLPELLEAIRKAHKGESMIAPNDLHVLLREAMRWRADEEKARTKLARLTPREVEILQELAIGRSDKEIAQNLRVKAKTVATHVANVLDKLEVASRLQAALLAIRYDFVEIGRD
jgi:DNA-binding NarL/FixJ family response regulator